MHADIAGQWFAGVDELGPQSLHLLHEPRSGLEAVVVVDNVACGPSIGGAVGLPAVLGGIPLDELGATGFGVAVCAEAAQEFADVSLAGARFVVQGFGSVGRHAARFLSERGAVLVAASDSAGGVLDPDGLDVDALLAHKAADQRRRDRLARAQGGGRA